jgi:hypothetical protein
MSPHVTVDAVGIFVGAGAGAALVPQQTPGVMQDVAGSLLPRMQDLVLRKLNVGCPIMPQICDSGMFGGSISTNAREHVVVVGVAVQHTVGEHELPQTVVATAGLGL